MPVFMFWNVKKMDLSNLISVACAEHSVDMLILSECTTDEARLTYRLNRDNSEKAYTEYKITRTGYVRLITSFPEYLIDPIYDNARVSIRNLRLPVGRPILLISAHLPSKLNMDSSTQYRVARQTRVEIESAEAKVGHNNTLVIGDLNMNPFEEGMVAADGFHGMMDRNIVLKEARTVQGLSHSFFYNPMWSRLGDSNSGPSGTFYFNNSGHICNIFWNTFDQVLLRVGLLDCFEQNNLKVLTNIGSTALLSNDGIEKDLSDHLPIVLNLETEKTI
jgi:hypothetical protein